MKKHGNGNIVGFEQKRSGVSCCESSTICFFVFDRLVLEGHRGGIDRFVLILSHLSGNLATLDDMEKRDGTKAIAFPRPALPLKTSLSGISHDAIIQI